MAVIVPFRGIYYNLKKVRNLSSVTAPPYDVISPEAQESLYGRHPWNVVRLILNKETPQDAPNNNRYTRAAALYREWRRDGVLSRAPNPHFYFLQEEFSTSILPFPFKKTAQETIVRRGFIGLIRLEDYSTGVVLPHEKTQTKPRADRLSLMEACEANFSQIFSLYPDEQRATPSIYSRVFSSRTPDLEVSDDEGVRRKLWMVEDPELLSRITNIMKTKKIFIADGHHRYETALAYREKQRERFPANTGRETYFFTMMYLSAMEDEGLIILPTHRVVFGLGGFSPSSFLEDLSGDFSVQSFDFAPQDETAVRETFLREFGSRADQSRSLGMLLQKENKYFILRLKNDRALDEASPGISRSLKALDVNLLHILVFQKRLKIGPRELAAGKNVLYFKDALDAVQAVQSQRGQAAFFLNPTTVSQVRDVSLAGETMPSKSTFFYPKLLTGLVMNPLDPHEEIAAP